MWSSDISNELISSLTNFCELSNLTLSKGETPETLQNILCNSKLPEKLLISSCKFDSETYCKTTLFKNELFELLLIGWLPGQATAIHDHNKSIGALLVINGNCIELKYKLTINQWIG